MAASCILCCRGGMNRPRSVAETGVRMGSTLRFNRPAIDEATFGCLRKKVIFATLQHGPRQLTAGPMNFTGPVFSGNSEKLFVIGEQRRGEVGAL